jgi:membrane fusion protein, multidrug efflux system
VSVANAADGPAGNLLAAMGPRLRVAAALAALLVVLGACKKETEKVERPPPEVTFVTVAAKNVPVSYDFVAQTESSQQVQIEARVEGFLNQRLYTEGTMVKQGDVLFQMDPRPFQADVDAAAAGLAKAQAAEVTTKANMEMFQALAKQHAGSQMDADVATGHYDEAVAAVDGAEADLERAKLRLSYTTITSPVTGLAGAARQQDGSYLSPQNADLTTVEVVSPIWVNFSVSENQLLFMRDQVAKHQLIEPQTKNFVVEILLPDGTTFGHRGTVTFTSPLFSAETGTFLVRATVDNPEGYLRPYQYVRARVTGFVRPDAILVPQRAVHTSAKGHFVWVLDADGKSELRPVGVGDWQGNDWFITEGLRPGDKVVVDGLITEPGQLVKAEPMKPEAA